MSRSETLRNGSLCPYRHCATISDSGTESPHSPEPSMLLWIEEFVADGAATPAIDDDVVVGIDADENRDVVAGGAGTTSW